MRKAVFFIAGVFLSAGSVQPAFFDIVNPAQLILEAEERPVSEDHIWTAPVTFHIKKGDAQIGMFFPIEEDDLADMSAWQIQILDHGRKVGFIQGKGRPASLSFPWSGLSAGGGVLPDGFYEARLVWMDSDKRTHSTNKALASLSTPLEMQRLCRLNLKFDYTAEGLVISVPDILIFNPGQFALRRDKMAVLREVSDFLCAHPGARVVVRGHTDSTGSAEANMELSRKRAFSVYNYLTANRVAASRLAYEGVGSSRPVASNATVAGRGRNRRVDVVLLKPTI